MIGSIGGSASAFTNSTSPGIFLSFANGIVPLARDWKPDYEALGIADEASKHYHRVNHHKSSITLQFTFQKAMVKPRCKRLIRRWDQPTAVAFQKQIILPRREWRGIEIRGYNPFPSKECVVMNAKDTADVIKDCFEIGAYIAALLFFYYRARSGYLMVDMGISVDCERKRKPGSGNKDYLGISVALKKGERAGLVLHDAQVRITNCSTHQVVGIYPLTTIWRANRTGKVADSEASSKLCPEERPRRTSLPETSRAQIDWTCIPGDFPRINLPPGDESKLAAFVEVDADVPYMVEAIVLAQTIFLGCIKNRFGQWRAAKVSLPLVAEPKPGNS
jgi:hypothetical protein